MEAVSMYPWKDLGCGLQVWDIFKAFKVDIICIT